MTLVTLRTNHLGQHNYFFHKKSGRSAWTLEDAATSVAASARGRGRRKGESGRHRVTKSMDGGCSNHITIYMDLNHQLALILIEVWLHYRW